MTAAERKSRIAPKLTISLSGLIEQLRADGRFADHPITHPHPLLIAVRSEDRIVLVAPAVVWDNGREIFKPFAAHPAL